MQTQQTQKQQENYIAREYKKEVIEVIEKRVSASDTKILQQTHLVTKRCIIKRVE